MIVSRTPFRITLGGGGTDLPSYYRRYGGFVVAMGIDKYMYVMVNPPLADDKVRLHYTKSEVVDHIDELKHELAREAMRLHGIYKKMEVASMADLPAGAGLGSSSAYLVGLLNCLHHYRREYVTLQELAEEACYIEIDVLRKPVGKQDQYMAAYGGCTAIDIATDGRVRVEQIQLDPGVAAELIANTHLYFTGAIRDALGILRKQSEKVGKAEAPGHEEAVNAMHAIKEIGYRSLEALQAGDLDAWGRLLHEHWEAKKRVSRSVTVPGIDELYEEVRDRFGVLGGKIAGAGGGGFLLLYCPRRHAELEEFMARCGLRRMHYAFEPEGSKVVANVSSTWSDWLHGGNGTARPEGLGRVVWAGAGAACG